MRISFHRGVASDLAVLKWGEYHQAQCQVFEVVVVVGAGFFLSFKALPWLWSEKEKKKNRQDLTLESNWKKDRCMSGCHMSPCQRRWVAAASFGHSATSVWPEAV